MKRSDYLKYYMKSLRNWGVGVLAILMVLPVVVFAQSAPGDVAIRSEGALIALLLRILGLLRTLFWIAVVFFILLAAFYYLTSGGDPGKTGKANQMLMYAVIAIVVALVATSLPYLVRSLLGGN